MFLRILYVCALASVLSGCAIFQKKVKVYDEELCVVAGVLSAGSDCVSTLSGMHRSMSLDETIEFLEPQIDPPRAAAIIMAATTWEHIKTTLEQLCEMLKGACTEEAVKRLQTVSGNIVELQEGAEDKKRARGVD